VAKFLEVFIVRFDHATQPLVSIESVGEFFHAAIAGGPHQNAKAMGCLLMAFFHSDAYLKSLRLYVCGQQTSCSIFQHHHCLVA
jgi:hypothetical protein